MKLITVIGNIASGKSTFSELLAKNIPAIRVPADELYKKNPFFSLAVRDRKRWSLTSDLWFLYERVQMAKKFPLYLKKKHVVVDSGIPMSWIYANSRLNNGYYNQHEWSLYQRYYEELTSHLFPSDIIVNIEINEKTAFERIRKRNRLFEIRYFTPSYLKGLKRSIQTFRETVKGKTKIITIDGNTDFRNNEQTVLAFIAQLLK